MRTPSFTTALMLLSGVGTALSAQEVMTYEACYVPSVGAIYLLNRPGLPTACLSEAHIAVTWTDGGDLADGAVTEAKLAFDPTTQAELDGFIAGLAAAGTINADANPVEWTQLRNVPAGLADGVDNDGGTPADLACTGCVGTTDLADAAVTGVQLADGTVSEEELAFDPATQTELDAVTTELAAAGTINSAGNPVHWTQLVDVPPDIADGVDDVGNVTDHATLTGLGADDHPQYLRAGVRDAPNGFAVTGTVGTGTIPASGAGTRLMWHPARGAFRAGFAAGTEWDDANVGDFSVALGAETTASGLNSTAMGIATVAGGLSSTALGDGTAASGGQSTAVGVRTTASGPQSTAMGTETTATGVASTAMGAETTASGSASTAMGFNTTASGANSTAMGTVTIAQARTSLAIGRFNVATGSSSSWVDTDPLFVAGNGSSAAARSNALTLLKNGDLDVAGTVTAGAFAGDGSGLTNLPTGVTDHAGLTGLEADDHPQYLLAGVRDAPNGFAVTGTAGSGTIPATGVGVRLMWYPGRAAFRAGRTAGAEWDDANVGASSMAFGEGTTAGGSASVAMGNGTSALGFFSTAMGSLTTASGRASTAMGFNTIASGDSALATGSSTTASGAASTAMGNGTTASGAGSTAMGFFSNAGGVTSTAMGSRSIASGSFATAMGRVTNAAGDISTAMGANTTASGDVSTAMGSSTTASGSRAAAMGSGTTAQAFASLVIGQDNVVTGTPTFWAPTDPLFVAGNGVGIVPSNALTLLKNGNLTIAGTLTQNSDIRLKEDIEPVGDALDGILGLTPIRYRFRPGTGHPTEPQLGLSAQEVRRAFPELVTEDSEGHLSVAYANLTAVLVRAVQEQQEQIELLRAEVEALRAPEARAARR